MLHFTRPIRLSFGSVASFVTESIRQLDATAQVNISNPITTLDQLDDSLICDMIAVAKMDIMEVLAQFTYGVDGNICDISALCQNQIS